MPEILKKRKGRRGRIAKSDTYNLLERLLKHENSVLWFMSDHDMIFTNNTGERVIRMSRLKMKVSGCFRTNRMHG